MLTFLILLSGAGLFIWLVFIIVICTIDFKRDFEKGL